MRTALRAAAGALLALLLGACVHYDGATYKTVAEGQLSIRGASIVLDSRDCAAHRAGAAALADRDGEARALKVPLGTARALEKLRAEHLWQGRVCDALLALAGRGELDTDSEARALAAWARMWATGRALVAAGW